MRYLQTSLWLTAFVAVYAGTASPCHADTVTLKNGREIHGRLVEEKIDSIRIRTSGGTITISKAEVATFSENDSWEEYERPRSVAEIEAAKKKAEEAKKADKDKDKDDKGKPKPKPKDGDKDDDEPKSREDLWSWDSELTEEQIEECTPYRDQLWDELDKLGPTAEERLKKYVMSGEEKTAAKALAHRMGLNRRTGSAVKLRQNALKELIDGYGLKATETLVRLLSSENVWQARGAAEGIPKLAGLGEEGEAKWLLQHFKAPQGLVNLLDHQGDMQSPFIRELAAKALTAMTDQKIGWVKLDKPDPMRSTAETQKFRQWRVWWDRFEPWWKNREKESAERRTQIAADLENLAKGIAPDGSTPGKEEG